MADQNPTLSTKAPSTADICAKLMSTARADHLDWEARIVIGHAIGRLQQFARVIAQPAAKPAFWYRPRSDGGYEGPVADAALDNVRRHSGAWTPLYVAQHAPATHPDIERYEHQRALMEANRNEAADQWHAGMPMTERERRFFEYGFASGWTRCRAVAIVSQPSAMLSAPAAADGVCIHGKGFQCVTCWPHPAAPSDAVAPSKKDRGPAHG
ncbi:hypothetical protein [Pseudacidovorax sp. NFM-22]|uniref:hypothetical protein n=1 Tax=Pseudacidovorax sp. NFM-22 TaxID=2744469 RepID=UPI001F39885B|nr:hypothetical protein [Pseudacidovorax sp. NFM-22]